MKWYRIRFNKKLCNDTGHEQNVCQDEFFLQGRSLADALERAEMAFCKTKRIQTWTDCADSVECLFDETGAAPANGARDGASSGLPGTSSP